MISSREIKQKISLSVLVEQIKWLQYFEGHQPSRSDPVSICCWQTTALPQKGQRKAKNYQEQPNIFPQLGADENLLCCFREEGAK